MQMASTVIRSQLHSAPIQCVVYIDVLLTNLHQPQDLGNYLLFFIHFSFIKNDNKERQHHKEIALI